MKILMIGGTGTISSAITRQLAESDNELWLLNRGTRKHEVPASVKQIIADIDDEAEVLRQIGDTQFDAVCEFIGFLPSQVERDIRLFKGRTRQYVHASMPISRQHQRITNLPPVILSRKVPRLPTPIGSIHAIR